MRSAIVTGKALLTSTSLAMRGTCNSLIVLGSFSDGLLERFARLWADLSRMWVVQAELTTPEDDRCHAPTPPIFASACSPPVRPGRAARPRWRGASRLASGRCRAGSGRRAARAGASRRCRPTAGRCSGARLRCWPGWWASRTMPRWPSMPSVWRRAPVSGAALRRSAGRSRHSGLCGRKDAPGF